MNTQSNVSLRTVVLSAVLAVAVISPVSSIADDRAEAARQTGSWPVESGDSLWAISTRVLSGEDFQTQEEFRNRVFELNNQAFVRNDPSRLRLNVTLTLPELPNTNIAETTEATVTEIVVAPTPEEPVEPDNTEESTEATQSESVAEVEPKLPALEAIGKVVFARGQMTAERGSSATRTLSRNSEIFQGDKITTPASGFGHLRFIDGALVAMRPSTQLSIEKFNFNGEQDGSESSVLRLIRGGFRTITGAIGKVNKKNYQVNTVIATVGIRGTHYGLRLCEPSCDTENGTQHRGLLGGVVDGTIAVENRSGQTEFGNDEYFSVASIDDIPITMIAPPGLIFDGSETSARGPSDGDDSDDNQGSSAESSMLLDNSNEAIDALITNQSNFAEPTQMGSTPPTPPTDPPPPTEPPPQTEPIN